MGGSVTNPDNDLGYYTVHLELWFSEADRCWGKTCLAWKLSGGHPAVAAKRSELSPTELHVHLNSGFDVQSHPALKVRVDVQ